MSNGIDKPKSKVREMLLDGETGAKIKQETSLRQKDIRRVQKEITKHF
ncbi:hypothetical protein [Clostridium sp. DJ247]|nr:hypothetical protein [Clostridium sp. DJ247]MBC2581130.1 hypothetical protein [Clostridium sp. DJ247]